MERGKTGSEAEVKRLRFPCSYCSRSFKTFEEVKRHIRNAHTPKHAETG